MGFAIKRTDGTYRAWNKNAKDDSLLAGEVWEVLNQPPTIGPPLGFVDPIKEAKALLVSNPNKAVTVKDLMDLGLV